MEARTDLKSIHFLIQKATLFATVNVFSSFFAASEFHSRFEIHYETCATYSDAGVLHFKNKPVPSEFLKNVMAASRLRIRYYKEHKSLIFPTLEQT